MLRTNVLTYPSVPFLISNRCCVGKPMANFIFSLLPLYKTFLNTVPLFVLDAVYLIRQWFILRCGICYNGKIVASYLQKREMLRPLLISQPFCSPIATLPKVKPRDEAFYFALKGLTFTKIKRETSQLSNNFYLSNVEAQMFTMLHTREREWYDYFFFAY